jgi:hypothetical protein
MTLTVILLGLAALAQGVAGIALLRMVQRLDHRLRRLENPPPARRPVDRR